MTKWVALILAIAVAAATAAGGATLSVVPDKNWYIVGETITLSINGDAQGASSAYGIFGRLEFNGAFVDILSTSQKLIGSGGWIKGTLETNDTNASSPTSATVEAFDQLKLSGGSQTATSPIATVILLAQAPGIVNPIWNTTAGSGYELAYFGLTSAPGTSFTIGPEPSTMTLFSLGLAGLAISRRLRRPS